jgi:hypothetical protein
MKTIKEDYKVYTKYFFFVAMCSISKEEKLSPCFPIKPRPTYFFPAMEKNHGKNTDPFF